MNWEAGGVFFYMLVGGILVGIAARLNRDPVDDTWPYIATDVIFMIAWPVFILALGYGALCDRIEGKRDGD